MALLAFGAINSARAFPNYIAFSNEVWGGTNNTYKVLSDSNVDWGQTLKQVNSYIKRNGIQRCWIAANGTPDIATASLPCRLLPAPFQWMDHATEDIPRSIDGTIFLSTQALPAEFPNMYEAIAGTKPTAIIGGAMLVYNGHFDLPRAAEWVHTTNSTFFFQHARLAEAIAEMRQTIAIDPTDPRSHFALGMYLAAAAQPEAAREELSECMRLASLNSSEFGGLREIAERQLQQLH